MSIIHTVSSLLARELLKRLDEQPPAEPYPTTLTRTDSDYHPPNTLATDEYQHRIRQRRRTASNYPRG